jgi:UDP-glucose 4-epimerase
MTSRQRRAIVTGGKGFIGSHLVDRLETEGWRVLVIDNRLGEPENDVTSVAAQRAAAAFRPDLLVHAAAQTKVLSSILDPARDAESNVIGTIRMLEAAREAGSTRFIFLSSAAVYGNPVRLPVGEDHPRGPLCPYGLSKLAAMTYVDHYRVHRNLPAVTLIPANVYGPRQETGTDGAVVSSFMSSVIRGDPLPVEGDGGQTRDFVYIGDLVEAVWLAWLRLDADPTGLESCLNIGTGLETSISDLAALVEEVAGRKTGRVERPARPGDIRRSCLAGELARRSLGWSPRLDLRAGLELTFNWWSHLSA